MCGEGLKRKILPIGSAVPGSGNGWIYYISPDKLREFVGTNYIRPVFRSQQGGGLMVSTFAACLWAMIALFLGGAWGITAAALIHAAKDHKEDKEDDDHENN